MQKALQPEEMPLDLIAFKVRGNITVSAPMRTVGKVNLTKPKVALARGFN